MNITIILVILNGIIPLSSSISTGSNKLDTKASTCPLESELLIQDSNYHIWVVIIVVGDIERDAHGSTALTNILLSNGCPINQIKKLIEENATKEAILHIPFEWLETNDIDKDDIVIFYFSMHGYQIKDQQPLDEPDNYDEFVAPYDYDANNLSTYILDEELNERFDVLKLNNLVVIFETCNSGGMIDGSQDLSNSGRVILTSCAANESSWPIFLRKQWLFPHYLFQGLSGFADLNKDRWITAEEAYYYAKNPTIIRSAILAKIFSLIPFIPHDFFPQHPQLYDGWPSAENNSKELRLF